MGTATREMEELADRVNGNAGLIRRGRFISLEFLLQIGDEAHHITIEKGHLAAITPGNPGPLLMRPWRFAIYLEEGAWSRFRQPMPRPGYHDLFAMCKLGVARIEGDIHPLMANLRYFKELLATARANPHEAARGR